MCVSDVLFDLCGVLVDWQPRRALLGEVPAEIVDDLMAGDDRCGFMYFDDLLDGGMPLEEMLAFFEREHGREYAEVLRLYYARLEHSIVGYVDGMRELLVELRSSGVRCWGLTNWSRDGFPAFSRRLPDLGELLEGIVVSGVEGVKKPEPAIYRLCAERFGLDPRRTVFFDDNQFNVDAASCEGFLAEPFIDAAHARLALRSRGVGV